MDAWMDVWMAGWLDVCWLAGCVDGWLTDWMCRCVDDKLDARLAGLM